MLQSLVRHRVAALLLLGMVVVGAASPVPQALAQPRAAGPLNDAFQRAAREFDVPRDLLVAIAYAETHFDDHGGKPSVDKGYGLMHLVDNPRARTLGRAAALLHVPEQALQTDAVQNIRGGAAVLRALADQHGLAGGDRQDLGAWYPVVARYSNATSDTVARFYADEVFRLLGSGLSGQSPQGETLSVAAQPIAPQVGEYATVAAAQAPDYESALWVPASSSNYDVARRPGEYPIKYVIIHTTEGSYTSAINWFQNPASGASSHYVIRSRDGQITQMVREQDIAWHAGNWDYNTWSIGIEHEAYIGDKSWYTDVMYRTSAALTRAICRKYGIPMDRQHIIGHNEIPDPDDPGRYGGRDNHRDPGPYWNWDYYMQLVNTTPATPTGPVPGATYFPETGHNLYGAFRDYWNVSGGLPVFGYPRTEEFAEQNPDDGQVYTVQYFERQRFEWHPQNAAPYHVLLGRLGAVDAQRRGLTGSAPFRPLPAGTTGDANCTFVPETGHHLCFGFRAYWQSHGLEFGDPGVSYRESLALFGYPISQEFRMIKEDGREYTVQYFERARFEWHPQNAAPYDILLGLLGNQELQNRGWIR